MIHMAQFPKDHRILRFSIRSEAGADVDSDLTLALDALVLRSPAEVAVVYRFDEESSEFRAIARRTNPIARLSDFDAILSRAASLWLEHLAEPTQGRPSLDTLFEEFPEVIQNKLQSCLVVPVRGVDGLIGILTVGRSEIRQFDSPSLELAQRSARLLAAVLERDSLQRKLLGRKVIESAKGILQARRRLSEREAYLELRNESRRRRISMVEIAREVIESQFRRSAFRSSPNSRIPSIGS